MGVSQSQGSLCQGSHIKDYGNNHINYTRISGPCLVDVYSIVKFEKLSQQQHPKDPLAWVAAKPQTPSLFRPQDSSKIPMQPMGGPALPYNCYTSQQSQISRCNFPIQQSSYRVLEGQYVTSISRFGPRMYP